ncbi:MAG: phage holin, LLH family [Verrucomicrobiota bacterium]|nr:phage holin, LLH family [Verrucomicrobiota bacterium]
MRSFFLRLFARLTGLSVSVWNFIEPVLVKSGKSFLETALPVALEIVAHLSVQNLSSADKRNIALRSLRVELTKAGIEAADHALNLAVELAYSKLKAS